MLDQTILQAQRAASLEDALSAKSEELSDIKRRTAGFDKEVGFLESEVRRIRSEYDHLKKENGILKNRLMDGGQGLRKSVAVREAEGEK
jgi:archaellum component FlaC